MMCTKRTKQQGFTLVETLVSITILLIIVTGPMTISMSTARSTSFASEQVVAFFLAQEGAEIAQKARDELLLQGFAGTEPDPWGEFSDDGVGADYETCYKTTGCGLMLNTNADGSVYTPLWDCSAGNKCKLYEDTAANKRARYTYDSAGGKPETSYTRVITFTKLSDWDVKVVSTVTWRTGTLLKRQQVSVETHLFDIYEN